MLLRTVFLATEKVLSEIGECFWKKYSFDIKTLYTDDVELVSQTQHNIKAGEGSSHEVPVLWESLLLPVCLTLCITQPLVHSQQLCVNEGKGATSGQSQCLKNAVTH